MKKNHLILLAFIVLFVSSCRKASETAAGTYHGNYSVLYVPYSGTATVTTSGDKVNISFASSSLGLSISVHGVSVATSSNGENISFSYSHYSITNGEVTIVSGSLTNNSITLVAEYNSGGYPTGVIFSGEK